MQHLLWRYVHRIVVQDGNYRGVHRGIPLGCPLSPLVGALYLKALDDRIQQTGLFYARFMDDWVILAPTRWKLRRAIRVVCETLAALKLAQHPDKTFIGRTSRGFDFLGYTFSPSGLGVAAKTLERFAARVTRLYEQGAGATRIGAYVRHWRPWVESGLGTRHRAVGALLEQGIRCPRINGAVATGWPPGPLCAAQHQGLSTSRRGLCHTACRA